MTHLLDHLLSRVPEPYSGREAAATQRASLRGGAAESGGSRRPAVAGPAGDGGAPGSSGMPAQISSPNGASKRTSEYSTTPSSGPIVADTSEACVSRRVATRTLPNVLWSDQSDSQ